MPIDLNDNPAPTARGTLPAIENELPAYRAVSPAAVVAMVLGVASVLAFASPYFLALAVGSVALGFLADRKIQRFPDALTGRGLAQAGVGLGLIFGLSSIAVTTAQGIVRVNQAKAFARTYEEALTKGTFAEAVWYGQAADARATTDPEALIKSMTKPGPELMSFNDHYGPLKALKEALAGPKAQLRRVRVENHGDQDLTQYVGMVYQVLTPGAKDPSDRDRRALVVFKGNADHKGRLAWWASDVVFPYKDKSFVAPAPERKPGDDGHGHSH